MFGLYKAARTELGNDVVSSHNVRFKYATITADHNTRTEILVYKFSLRFEISLSRRETMIKKWDRMINL